MTGGIKTLNAFLKKYPTAGKITIAAITDAVGSEKAQKMAAALQDYITEKLTFGEKVINNTTGWLLDISKLLGGITFRERDIAFLFQGIAVTTYQHEVAQASVQQSNRTTFIVRTQRQ